ncbi:GNAT family N-acetyltransferase [Roseibium sp. HPY-6]|uniref:GNAT family N-acetyltransferase n=1 Tax=Roseibium sp. HPY-6 TaxID=3229852 RepID=UPI00338FFECE
MAAANWPHTGNDTLTYFRGRQADMTIRLSEQISDTDTYLSLRAAGGLSSYDRDAADIGLKNSLYSVMLLDQDRTIGMGRLVGDGGCFVQVADIIVHPDFQGRGLGKKIMEALTSFIETRLPPSIYVSLIADVPANHLYEQFGFRETAPSSLGMARRGR